MIFNNKSSYRYNNISLYQYISFIMLRTAFLNTKSTIITYPKSNYINCIIINEKCNNYIIWLQNHNNLINKDKYIFIKFINICRQQWLSSSICLIVDLVYIGANALQILYNEESFEVSRFIKFFINYLNYTKVEYEISAIFAGASKVATKIMDIKNLNYYSPFDLDLFYQGG